MANKVESPIQTDFWIRFSPFEGMTRFKKNDNINGVGGSREFVIGDLVKGQVVVEPFLSGDDQTNLITTEGLHGFKIRQLAQALGRICVRLYPVRESNPLTIRSHIFLPDLLQLTELVSADFWEWDGTLTEKGHYFYNFRKNGTRGGKGLIIDTDLTSISSTLDRIEFGFSARKRRISLSRSR